MKNKCKICGCTDLNCANCIEKTGHPCIWVDDDKDLCSSCMFHDHALTLLKNLVNASGAEFEDEAMALNILTHSIKLIVHNTIELIEGYPTDEVLEIIKSVSNGEN